MPKNIEIKAKVQNISGIHTLARELCGSDGEIINQVDTFFNVPNGRLKLRQILEEESQLIFYIRPDESGPKLSSFDKVLVGKSGEDLKILLSNSLGVKGIVVKKRTLYLIEPTRIHVDEVEGLGSFVELEVKLEKGLSPDDGNAIAKNLMRKLKIEEDDLVDKAYIDLLLNGSLQPPNKRED